MTGYTLNGVAGRIRDLENRVGGAYYVALCWLAMNRNSGKGSRKLLEGKIFGQDKPTSTFRNAWRIAEKSFAEGFHAECRKAVVDMGLDDAVAYAVGRLEEHRAAVGATNMATYEERCRYASEADVPIVAEEEPAPDRADAGQALRLETSAPRPAQSNLELAMACVEALDENEAAIFAAWFGRRLEATPPAMTAQPLAMAA
ncbi:MAG: hypothetical protein F9K19_25230 [Rhizobiaceae bacterium]|nr:MAG: hypothetical protein F9K19_25230 [Rhizobiaceae bacterium]